MEGVNKIQANLLYFLRKLGFSETESTFLKEANIKDASLEIEGKSDNEFLLFDTSNLKLSAYEEFEILNEWMDNVIDIYKDELLALKFPIFLYLLFLFLKSENIESCNDTFNVY